MGTADSAAAQSLVLKLDATSINTALVAPFLSSSLSLSLPNSHGARPVHLIISMIIWIRTSKLSLTKCLSQLLADAVFALPPIPVLSLVHLSTPGPSVENWLSVTHTGCEASINAQPGALEAPHPAG